MADNPENPRRFLDPKTIARIGGLDLRARQVVEGYISGMHRSPFFGHSVEFVQHREYVAGDDIRHLDWKVWSKTDRFYVKQFEEETNLRCQIVVDVSESMHYGRGAMNKYEYACTIAACLAYLITRQQDSAGLITFDSGIRQQLPPRSSKNHLEAFVKGLHVSKPREKTDIRKTLQRVAEAFQQRSMVILISDLLSDREPLTKGLEMLRHRRHDVMVFHVMDDDEINFPFAGTTRFEGMEELPDLLCDPRALRDGYLDALQEYLTEVRRACSRLGIDYMLTQTSDYLDAVLSRFLHARMGTKGTKASATIL
ncbi:DUF58 domain-containing protein [Tuwongella immobilis]|uniref:DUF58 domain-containing protein n=1 Tax=Tuwongella immobilis TaxID=692036 RepID=A0A6C2YRU5_9BACT|nr:DUF58 domain-containing protein [Tuwongella immobilis]VIP03879.1 Hypothetical conserved protein OS=uncultured planctomycete GN=HGMM_F48A06C26 PE=4 SV=1: DUF58 [Tuwongella immobilis]VTS05125.1 Hypothetical conserved protein OS=uncultured planctomycete GN=HGMM_F48A06C26 PE=4 SV=1: DUF58 [Tuwongella immobilis]